MSDSAILKSFDPIEDEKASVLILGSMPGAESLRKGQYYAHSRNSFWIIMGRLVDAGPGLAYADRVRILKDRRIALWDVLKTCAREGSLDSSIKDETIEVNDFPAFFEQHPHITHVFFNGTKAQASYMQYVMPTLTARQRRLQCRRLPSTSPAYAAMSPDEKAECWRAVVESIKPGKATATMGVW